jgi:hypothetical protein
MIYFVGVPKQKIRTSTQQKNKIFRSLGDDFANYKLSTTAPIIYF